MQKHVNLVDLVKSFPTNIYLQNLASIQKRTSLVKFVDLAEKSGKGSISNLSTKVALARGHILMCPVLFFGLALSKFSKEEGLKQSSWYGLILKPVISVSGLLREKGRAEVRKETSETEGCSEGT